MTPDELRLRLVEEELIDDHPLSASPPLSPWYLHLLSAFGAWLASLFLLIFWVAFLNHSWLSWVVVGLLQALLAAQVARSSQRDIWLHPSLALWLTGVGLTAAGAAWGVDHDPQSFWAAMATLLLLSFLYPRAIGRLLTLLGCGVILLVLLAESRPPLPCDLCVIVLTFVGGWLWLDQERWWRAGVGALVQPLGLASFMILFGVLMSSYWQWAREPATVASSVALSGAVLWLVARILHKLQAPLAASAWALGGTVAIGLVTSSAPGVMAGLGVLLVGFTLDSRLLEVLAIAFLLLFLSAYYYFLAISLLAKSLTLMALGALLLLLRRGVRVS